MENFRVNTSEVDIDLVIPNNWNPKDKLDENPVNNERYQQIKKGIQEHGLMMPVTVRTVDGLTTYEIIDGYHRWLACKELGYTKILINNLGLLEDAVARALTILFERAKIEVNPVKEAELLKDIFALLPDYEAMAKLLPFDAAMIESKINLIQHDWDQYNKEGQGGDDEMGMEKFFFKVGAEDAEICNKALGLTGEENKDLAFINICKFFSQQSADDGEENEEELEDN